jgi:antitoxin component of RelBE/YafQ-DinJ toxin-antitoxin module
MKGLFRTVARKRRIPFDLTLNDPFFSESNMKWLEHCRADQAKRNYAPAFFPASPAAVNSVIQQLFQRLRNIILNIIFSGGIFYVSSRYYKGNKAGNKTRANPNVQPPRNNAKLQT